MNNKEHIARWIKIAFEQGYEAALDGEKQCYAWENSTAKQIHDNLMKDAVTDLTVKS